MPSSGPKYPNQQLRAVSLETFFRGRFAVLSGLEKLQQRYEAELPHLFVPTLLPGEPQAMRPYQLRSADQSESLAVAINQVTFVSFKYPGFAAFRDRALPLIRAAWEAFGVTDLTRLTYSYENELVLPRDSCGDVPVSKIVRLAEPAGGTPVQGLSLEWSRRWEAGIEHGKVSTVSDPPSVELLRFSLSASVVPGGLTTEVESNVLKAHDRAIQMFEDLITEEFRVFLQGRETEEGADGPGA